MVSLESCDCLSRHRSELPVDRAGVVTVPLQLCLHVDHDLVRRQIAVTIDRTVVRIVSVSVVTPRRIPVTPVPEIPASANKDDAVVVAAPPTPIMPLPVVISKRSILLPAESAAPPIVRDRHISVSVDSDVPSGVAGNSPVTKISSRVYCNIALDTSSIVLSNSAFTQTNIGRVLRTSGRVCVSLAQTSIGRVTIEPRCGAVGMCPHRRRGNAALRPDGRRSGHLPCPHRRDLRFRVPARASMDRCRGSVVIVLFRLGQRRRCERYTRAY